MSRPRACGFPDVSTTGVRPGVKLARVNGEVTLAQAGGVLQNKLVVGSINVTAPGVTIRNVKIIATDPYYAVQAFSWKNDVSGLTLDHVEIDLNGNYGIKGIAFDGYTARNVFIHNGSDCAHIGQHVAIVDSYCALGPDHNGDGVPDSAAFCRGKDHFDGLQSDGGSDITIRHNTIRNPCAQTSAILLSTNTSSIDHVTIDHNLLSGGGYTVYCGTDEGGEATHAQYTRNVISREYFRRGGRWGSTTSCVHGIQQHGNRWDTSSAR